MKLYSNRIFYCRSCSFSHIGLYFFELECARILKKNKNNNVLISVTIYPRAFLLDVNFASCNHGLRKHFWHYFGSFQTAVVLHT